MQWCQHVDEKDRKVGWGQGRQTWVSGTRWRRRGCWPSGPMYFESAWAGCFGRAESRTSGAARLDRIEGVPEQWLVVKAALIVA
jgi:hypothetical protein